MYPNHLKEHHPYSWAREAFVTGKIPADQAILMAAADLNFNAECALGMHGPSLEIAGRIVREQWVKEAYEEQMRQRRGET
jgi:hypothetical protein